MNRRQLQNLLTLRKHQREQAELSFLQAGQVRDRVESTLKQAELAHQAELAVQASYLQHQSIDPQSLHAATQHNHFHQQRIKAIVNELAMADAAWEQAKAELLQRRLAEEIVGKLLERARQEWRAAQDLAEAKFLDDIGQRLRQPFE